MNTIRSSVTFCTAVLFIGIFFPYNMQAQICNGSLGDAVVNVGFGSGSGIGRALPVAVTSYTFVSNDCPDDGSYTIINATRSCFGNSWHTITEDHTPGDVNGYMMLVNASYNPGDFYVDTVKGLCPGTTYEFGAWIVNVLSSSAGCSPPIHPVLVFNIETVTGQVLGTYSTSAISESFNPEWKQYGLFFTTPSTTNTVVIRLTNNAPGGCGNDLALDDITFRPCGPVINATVNTNQTTIDFCTPAIATATLSAVMGSGYAAASVQWQESVDNGITWADIPGAININYSFNKTAVGSYQYRLSAAEGANISLGNCRVASNTVTIGIHNPPTVAAASNSPVCENDTIRLHANGAVDYSWAGPAGFTSPSTAPSFAALLNAAGEYRVTGTDMFGCANTGAAMVAIYPHPFAVVNNNQSICEGGSVPLSASGGSTYLWSPAAGLSAVNIAGPSASPVVTVTYTVTVTNGNVCTDTATIQISVYKKPVASAGPDKVILEGEPVVLEGTVTGSEIAYYWAPGDFLNDPSLLHPTSNADYDRTYTLQVVSNVGCGMDEDKVLVKVFKQLYIPNAFTPNNDGDNDVWRIAALLAFPEATVSVYNRNGQKIFEGRSGTGWDGTYKGQLQDPGAYVYIIDFKNKRPVKKGWVMLVR